AIVQFPDVKKATEAVIDVMNRGVGIQCVELCDSEFMRSTNLYGASQRKYPEADSLFFKFQGPTPASILESARIVKEVIKKHGGTGFELARSEKEANDLWADRKNALYSGLALVEGCRGWSTDVCVPVSKLPALVYETKKDIQELGIVSTIVGHVGDGTTKSSRLPGEVVHRMVERAIKMEGTCTGEHGVGIGKREYLYAELGEGTVELMRSIKKTIDPLGLFNPGKVSGVLRVLGVRSHSDVDPVLVLPIIRNVTAVSRQEGDKCGEALNAKTNVNMKGWDFLGTAWRL
ncbi:FAD-linked oxidase-like protein, partial [Melanogaster broomeanus]